MSHNEIPPLRLGPALDNYDSDSSSNTDTSGVKLADHPHSTFNAQPTSGRSAASSSTDQPLIRLPNSSSFSPISESANLKSARSIASMSDRNITEATARLHLHKEEQDRKGAYPKVITIGISGSTSSGKTSLALLLAEIFGQTFNNELFIVHQDDFFLPKPTRSIPWTTFRPMEEDKEFIRSSIGKGFWNMGEVVAPEIRHLGSELRKDNFCLEERDDCVQLDNKALIDKKHPNDNDSVVRDKDQVEIPEVVYALDCDCWNAMGTKGFIDTIKYLRRTGGEDNGNFRKFMSQPLRQSEATEADKFLKRWSNHEVVTELKERVQNFVRTHINDATELPKLCFVEGFLLYAEPPKSSDHNKDHAKHQLLQQLDVKLFLPTSKAASLAQRFERPIYKDKEQVSAGQMWKTRGYFEDVAWANHVRESKWMFANEDIEQTTPSAEAVEMGVHVRKTVDAEQGDTLEWAVGVILGTVLKEVMKLV